MPDTACACCFSDDRDVVMLRKSADMSGFTPEYWCADCLEAFVDALRREEVGPRGFRRCYEAVKAANAPQMSRDDVIREMLEALERARACGVANILPLLDAAIEHGKQAMEGTKNG